MKRWNTITITVALIIFATAGLKAQTFPTESRWSLGAKTGFNLSHFWGTDFNKDDARLRPGGQVGGFVTWSNMRWFAITGELMYTTKGTRYHYTTPFGDGKSVTRVDYLEIPVMFRFFLVDEGNVRPHISAGPSVGFLMVAQNKGVDPESDVNSFYDDARKVDLGANLGGGVNIWVKKVWINPEIRYNLGLVSLMEDSNVRNGAVSLSLGVAVPLDKATPGN